MRKGKKPKSKRIDKTPSERYSGRSNARVESDSTPGSRFQPTVEPGSNDISWYARYPKLLAAAANIPTAKYPGSTIKVGSVDYSIPGVIALEFLPSIGVSTGDNSPASQLATEMYARIRGAFSGSLPIDGPDLVMYVFALANINMYIAWLKRMYRTLLSYSPINYTTVQVLLSAYGLSPEMATTLASERVWFYGEINRLIAAMRTFRVPALFDVFNRYVWLCDNVFMDSADLKQAQLYVFNPRGFYQATTLNTPDKIEATGLEMLASPLDPSMTPSFKNSVAKPLITFGDTLITALKSTAEALDINGYLDRAFKTTSWFALNDVDERDLITPTYNEEVLTQIENFRGIPGSWSITAFKDISGMNISQNPKTNAVLCNNSVTFTGIYNASLMTNLWTNHLNIRGEFDAAKATIATRMAAALRNISGSDDSGWTIQMDTATEYPLWMRYVTRQNIEGATSAFPGRVLAQTYAMSATLGAWSFTVEDASLETFDWHPFVYLFSLNSSNVATAVGVRGDIHSFTTLLSDTLNDIHRNCMYSEFNAFSLI